MIESKTFEDVIKDREGAIYIDKKYPNGIRFKVLRGPISLCAYVGVPENHPIEKYDYDEINIPAHGGLTFKGGGGDGDGLWDTGYCWFGWDYGHIEDACFYHYKDIPEHHQNDIKWTPQMVEEDSQETIQVFSDIIDGKTEIPITSMTESKHTPCEIYELLVRVALCGWAIDKYKETIIVTTWDINDSESYTWPGEVEDMPQSVYDEIKKRLEG